MKNKIALLLATWFYSGLIPPVILKGMGGTYGSFFSIPLCYFILKTGQSMGAVTVLVFLLGLWCVPKAEILLGAKTDWKNKTKTRDQNQITIDETFGMLVTCYPLTLISFNSYCLVLAAAFVLFRFFDIVKPPPARYFDNMKNAYGVMLDDFVAGVYSAIFLSVLVIVFKL
jgi:phosphatidylglycerophosphatase A